MVFNPFVELARDPVATLSVLGYALGLLALLVWTAGICWSNAVHARAQFQNHWHRWDYLPPAKWLGRVGLIPFILAIDVWAVAALIWLLTP